MRVLYPNQTDYQTYISFTTCHVDGGLFQLGNDSSCQVLQPDFVSGNFSINPKQKLPYMAKWVEAALIALPDSKVMVTGIKWSTSE